MNHLSIVLLAVLAIATLLVSTHAQRNPDAGLVRHFVSFKFLPSVSAETRKEVMTVYRSLLHKCVNATTGRPYIVSFDAGFPNSPEGKDQGMEQGYISTFASVAARNYFVGRPFHFPYDPHHDAFKKFVGPLLDPKDGVIVFDFTVLP